VAQPSSIAVTADSAPTGPINQLVDDTIQALENNDIDRALLYRISYRGVSRGPGIKEMVDCEK
jgi:hypothetical protein